MIVQYAFWASAPGAAQDVDVKMYPKNACTPATETSALGMLMEQPSRLEEAASTAAFVDR